MAGMLAIHGLSTPGILTGQNGVIAFSGAAVLPVGGAVLALSALPALRRPSSVSPLLLLQGVLVLGVVGARARGIRFPELVPAVPETGSTPAIVLSWSGLLLRRTRGSRRADVQSHRRRPTWSSSSGGVARRRSSPS